jgi:hypothetical protein
MMSGRQKYIQQTVPLVLESSAFEFEMATEKLKETNHQLFTKLQQN